MWVFHNFLESLEDTIGQNGLQPTPHGTAEFHNLSDFPEYREVLLRMRSALMAWRTETEDPLLMEDGWARLAQYEQVTPKG